MLAAVLTMGLLALVFAIGLAFASKKFSVNKDPRVEEVIKVLPGVNCGACGLAGCEAFAAAVVLGKVPVDGCIPGQKDVADKIAKILGKEAPYKKEHLVAQLRCNGGKKETSEKFEYRGIKGCKAANLMAGGSKSCSYGCLGFGDCVKVCRFDALHMGSNRLPVVDKEKCTACAACVKECPKKLYRLVPKDRKIHVLCSSKDNNKEVIKACKVGCIACRACEKVCPVQDKAIKVNDNLAEIDYSKCIMCGKCIDACPRKIIVSDNRKLSTENKEAKKA